MLKGPINFEKETQDGSLPTIHLNPYSFGLMYNYTRAAISMFSKFEDHLVFNIIISTYKLETGEKTNFLNKLHLEVRVFIRRVEY